MTWVAWVVWHLLRGHLLTIRRPYDAPVAWQFRCHCGDRRTLI